MAELKLTRETILSGAIREASRALQGPGVRFMTDDERDASVRDMLARAPAPDRIWVFGFGSLIWNPAFHFVERRAAHVHGFHRQFCLWARAGRGSPERPGLMLGLEPGGSCRGVVYRIAREAVNAELDIVWRREMLSMVYCPVWVAARTPEGIEHAVAFTANKRHERYAPHLDDAAKVRLLATGRGPLGHCRDYLFDTVTHLRALGMRDRGLEALAARVRAHMERHGDA